MRASGIGSTEVHCRNVMATGERGAFGGDDAVGELTWRLSLARRVGHTATGPAEVAEVAAASSRWR